MKFIHTSDWHLGQSFMNKSREPEHRAFLTWLLALMTTEKVDALIVAGDIFDSATPSSYARKTYFDFLTDIKATGCPQVVIVGGNHDSVAVLNETKLILESLNIKVVGGAEVEVKDEVVLIKDRDQKPVGVVCAVPYLRDRDVRKSVAGESSDQKSAALRQGITDHYTSVFDYATTLSAEHGGLPIVGTGHLTTTGGELSEGGRKLYIGTLEGYASDDFPGFDYVALGHLHKKQVMGKRNHIRYCGSPIPLSFMEANFDRTVNVVELAGRGSCPEVTEHVVPRIQQLKAVTGTLDEVMVKIDELKTDELEGDETIWLEVTVKATGIEGDLTQRLSALIEDRPLELLCIKIDRKDRASTVGEVPQVRLHEMTPEAVFAKRLEQDEFDEAKVEELTTRFNQVYSEVQESN